MQKLNVRPKILQGESLLSYVYRLAKGNHYQSISSFSFLSGKAGIYSNEFDEGTIKIISHLSDKQQVELYGMTLNALKQDLGSLLFNKVVLKRKIKYCPDCIKQVQFQKLIWSILRPI